MKVKLETKKFVSPTEIHFTATLLGVCLLLSIHFCLGLVRTLGKVRGYKTDKAPCPRDPVNTQCNYCLNFHLLYFKNSFIEMRSIYHAVCSFKMSTLGTFSVFKVVQPSHNQFQKLFITPKRNFPLLAHHSQTVYLP